MLTRTLVAVRDTKMTVPDPGPFSEPTCKVTVTQLTKGRPKFEEKAATGDPIECRKTRPARVSVKKGRGNRIGLQPIVEQG